MYAFHNFEPFHYLCPVLTVLVLKEYTEELYKKGFNDLENHDGVITHLETDILEGEVKWALETITTNKASGGNAIPAELTAD